MDKLKSGIEQHYGIKIAEFSVIRHIKNSSYLAKITTDKGAKYVVKSLFIQPKRQHFIVQSEQLLSSRGVRLAQPVPTKENRLFFLYRGYPYVLYEWIDGPTQKLKKIRDIREIAKTVAYFHKTSCGLQYPPQSKIYSHFDWIKEYSRRLGTLTSWKKQLGMKSDRKTRVILQAIPYFYKAGKKAKKMLKKSSYRSLSSTPHTEQSLVHGDMHPQNIIKNRNENTLIDFEDVRYDFPSKDLIRLLSMYTKKHRFSSEAFEQMLQGYRQIHHVSSEQLQLLYIDFLFPHIFERMLRRKKYRKWTLERIRHLIRQEKRKAKYIDRQYIRKVGPTKE